MPEPLNDKLSITLAQVNPTVGGLDKNAELILKVLRQASKDTDLVIFPEMVLTGYPLEDLVLKPSFLDDTKTYAQKIIDASKEFDFAFLLTLPIEQDGHIYNGFHLVHNGHILETRFKRQLPNYGVFDEARVFKAGPYPSPISFKGQNLGIMICEDMWSGDVTQHMMSQNIDILIVSNGSPYDCRKTDIRFSLARDRAKQADAPLIYVNPFGGQDELVFDGGSFIVDKNGHKIFQAPYFQNFVVETHWSKDNKNQWSCQITGESHSIPDQYEATYAACVLGLKDYWKKNGHTDVLIGLSGGIDSALSAAIAVDALGCDHVQAIMMPSPFTSQESLDAAALCAQKLNIKYDVIPISDGMTWLEDLLTDIDGLAHENMQSRLRGLILMTLSNSNGSLVLSTGNKSENAVGYATLYGDMCGAFSVLKDMFKTQVYALSNWRNNHHPKDGLGPKGLVIPEIIIERAPTAELRENQKDEDSLPPYDVLDNILQLLVEQDLSYEDIIAKGFDKQMVLDIWTRVDSQEYKRRQGPPGVKLTTRSFGRERRYPMTNNYNFLVKDKATDTE